MSALGKFLVSVTVMVTVAGLVTALGLIGARDELITEGRVEIDAQKNVIGELRATNASQQEALGEKERKIKKLTATNETQQKTIDKQEITIGELRATNASQQEAPEEKERKIKEQERSEEIGEVSVIKTNGTVERVS